ncbi:unnamed protein product [Eruca vesicaria subsp. sativa]|uniref:Alfin N-terminal domain-containing protein n=1 Tax=Eruca vesicaria subsp. sativa TaxID=29727 RepID=A0ABC8K6R6_ERUVS|nr:unnamed protein product [Eruca vesicaria subsp. sativa]
MDGGGGDGGGAAYNPHTMEEVYRDFMDRRNGMIKALTTVMVLLQQNAQAFSQMSYNLSMYKMEEVSIKTWNGGAVCLTIYERRNTLPHPPLKVLLESYIPLMKEME